MTYSSASSLNRKRYIQKNQNTVSFSKANSLAIGPVSNTIIVLVVACLIGLIYLTQVTKTNSFSYQIDRLQQQQVELKEEQKNLDLTAARLRSVSSKKVVKASDKLVVKQPSGVLY